MKQLLCLLSICVLFSCKKNISEPDAKQLAALHIEFDNIAGNMNLQLNTGIYRTNKGESFTVSKLLYFISNVAVQNTDGNWYSMPANEDYYLIKEGDDNKRHVKLLIPEGDYVALKFIVGVDSLRSAMNIDNRLGVLDPADEASEGMYWSWNQGYIFFKLEGTSPEAPTSPTGNIFRYHIGGFGGYSAPTINNIKQVNIDLRAGGIAKVRAARTANIHLMADVLKVFNGVANISIADNSTVMFSDISRKIANNYQHMFSHDHTEN